jgi:antitoxin ParD1/3/4
MQRQSISFTQPNNKWLEDQVTSKEYSSKSEVVNGLIRNARQINIIQAHLIQAEESGFTLQDRTEILTEIKSEAQRNGKL